MKREPDITKGVYYQGRIIPWDEWSRRCARKLPRRKGHYMKGFHHWVGKNQVSKRQAARQSRQEAKRYE